MAEPLKKEREGAREKERKFLFNFRLSTIEYNSFRPSSQTIENDVHKILKIKQIF